MFWQLGKSLNLYCYFDVVSVNLRRQLIYIFSLFSLSCSLKVSNISSFQANELRYSNSHTYEIDFFFLSSILLIPLKIFFGLLPWLIPKDATRDNIMPSFQEF